MPMLQPGHTPCRYIDDIGLEHDCVLAVLVVPMIGVEAAVFLVNDEEAMAVPLLREAA